MPSEVTNSVPGRGRDLMAAELLQCLVYRVHTSGFHFASMAVEARQKVESQATNIAWVKISF